MSGLEKCELEVQRMLLLGNLSICLRLTLHYTLCIRPGSNMMVAAILDAMAGHFRTQSNLVVDCVAFIRRTQRDGESFDASLQTSRR